MERVEFMAKLVMITQDLDGVNEISAENMQKLMSMKNS